MNVPLDDVYHFDVTTCSPTTGSPADADSTPTFSVYEEDTDTPMGVSGSFTKRSGKTGEYRGSFTVSTGNSFEAGKYYTVYAYATVGTVSGSVICGRFRCVVAENTAGTPVIDGTAVADSVLTRNASNVEATAGEHTLCTLILANMEFSISGDTLTIKRTDGSTTHYTKTLTTSPGADPITGIT